MRIVRTIILSLLITLVLWGVMSWPLPLHTFSGIPASAHNTEKNNVRTMIAGDHLQFLYHLWLAKDTFFGPTPLFYNLYEFNRGNLDERHDTAMRYYIPFSLMYSLCSLAGHAFGWNGMGLITLWLTFVFTLILARRYTTDPPAAWLAAAISVIFPYRWITLCGGSPTGLGMMWVPMAFYGIDVLVRDRRAWGGALAGAAIFLSGWSDPHVTFFTALSAPCWCVVCWLFNRETILPAAEELKSLSTAAIPLIIFAVCVLFQARGTKSGLADTEVADSARRIGEVALFSPHIEGIWAISGTGKDSHIYVGWFVLLLIVAGMAGTMARAFQKRIDPKRVLFPAILLFLGTVGIILLATGTNNPLGGAMTWLRLCRVLPPCGMIRQSAKIFIIMPIMIAMLVAITLPLLLSGSKAKKFSRWIYLAVGILLVLDYGHRVDPAICRLDTEQGAYRAVAEDARANGEEPFAIGIPVWPGNSHWTSLNQYYATLYRVRMMNGYRPTVRQTYFEDVYMRFESFNKGGYSKKQLKTLRDRGVGYIVLHENAFPEKVSPFPVSHVLRCLLAHPEIALLKQDGPVWAFKLVPAPEGIYKNVPDWNFHFPSRLWQAEKSVFDHAEIMESPDTSGNKYLRLEATTNSYMATQPYPVTQITNLCYMVRTRGPGTFKAIAAIDNELFLTDIQTGEDWSWYTVPVPVAKHYPRIQLRLNMLEDTIDVDVIVLATSDWDPAVPEASRTIPAPVFFHAGYTDLETEEVVLSPEREPADVIFYGPKLPFPAGAYKIIVNYSSDAEMGTPLGWLQPRYPAGDTNPSEILAGAPGELIYKHPHNLRLAIDLKYSRNAEMRIKNVEIKKIKP